MMVQLPNNNVADKIQEKVVPMPSGQITPLTLYNMLKHFSIFHLKQPAEVHIACSLCAAHIRIPVVSIRRLRRNVAREKEEVRSA